MFELEPLKDNTNLIFVHVPKCAGTTAVNNIWGAGVRSSVRGFDYRRVKQQFRQWLESKPKGQFVYGHIRYPELEALEASGIDYRLITFLRHPVDRIVSWYRYDASPASPIYQKFIEKNPDFSAWVRAIPANTVAGFTVGKVVDADQYAAKLIERFDFIGLQEYFADGMELLMKNLNRKYRPIRAMNVTMPNAHNAIKIDNALFAEIAEANKLDVQAFLKVKSLWEDRILKSAEI